jgi:thioredoxin 1
MKHLVLALSLVACNNVGVSTQKPNELRTTRHLANQVSCDAAEEKAEEIVSTIPYLDDKRFDAAIKGDAVLVEFFARWCRKCVEMAPALERLQERHPSVKIWRVDVDENPVSVKSEHVAIVPTLIFYRRGIVVGSLVGVYSDKVLDRLLDSDEL